MRTGRPKCKDASARVWRFEDAGPDYRFVRAADRLAKVADDWSDRLVGWKWDGLYKAGDHCLYAVVDDHDAPLALFAVKPTALRLKAGPTTRLDFFEVDPSVRGGPLPDAVFALFAKQCLDFGSDALAVGSLAVDEVIAFYKDLGGVENALKGWSVPRGLVAIGFTRGTLEALEERADGFEEENDP